MTTIQAIETRYAGCRFRSRLEARWAVFFDTLGISWEYEPEGLLVSWRLTLDEGRFRYLPDFRLPDLGLWAEVKGEWTEEECHRFCNAAASISSQDGGGCSGGNDVMVLGSVPRPGDPWAPWVLHMHKGDLVRTSFDGQGGWWCRGEIVATDWGGDDVYGGPDRKPLTYWRTALLEGDTLSAWATQPQIKRAVQAARSARFEHGENG